MNSKSRFIKTAFVFAALLTGASAFAAANGPGTFSYEGRLYDSSGVPLATQVKINIKIIDPTNSCVLYEEQSVSPIDLSLTNGYFSVGVGTGAQTKIFGSALSQVFSNMNPIAAETPPVAPCSGSYTPTAGDGRLLRVTVLDAGNNPTTLSPDVAIGSTPFAMVADNAAAVGGVPAMDLVQVPTGASSLNAALVTGATDLVTLITNATQIEALLGNSGQSGLPLPTYSGNPPTPAIGQVWYNNSSSQMMMQTSGGPIVVSGGGGGVTNVAASLPIQSSGGSTPTISISQANSSTNGYLSSTDWNAFNNKLSSFSTQPPGYIYAAPAGGGTPAFRALTAADVASFGTIVNGGNSFGGPASIGTMDPNSFSIKANNFPEITILPTGNVGINNTNPSVNLDVVGSVNISSGNYLYNMMPVLSTNGTSTGSSLTLGTGMNVVFGGTGQNVAVGPGALTTISSASGNNTAVGAFSLGHLVAGNANAAVGDSSMFYNSTGSYNVATGFMSGFHVGQFQSDSDNVVIGHTAGTNLGSVNVSPSSGNVLIGSNSAMSLTTGSGNIVVGSGVDVPNATTNNYLNIGNSIVANNVGTAAVNVGIGTMTPSSTLHVLGSIATNYTLVQGVSNYSLTAANSVVGVDASSQSVTLNLPDATSCPGRQYMIKRTDFDGNTLTVQANGGQTLDGVPSFNLNPYDSALVISDGNNWSVLGGQVTKFCTRAISGMSGTGNAFVNPFPASINVNYIIVGGGGGGGAGTSATAGQPGVSHAGTFVLNPGDSISVYAGGGGGGAGYALPYAGGGGGAGGYFGGGGGAAGSAGASGGGGGSSYFAINGTMKDEADGGAGGGASGTSGGMPGTMAAGSGGSGTTNGSPGSNNYGGGAGGTNSNGGGGGMCNSSGGSGGNYYSAMYFGGGGGGGACSGSGGGAGISSAGTAGTTMGGMGGGSSMSAQAGQINGAQSGGAPGIPALNLQTSSATLPAGAGSGGAANANTASGGSSGTVLFYYAAPTCLL